MFWNILLWIATFALNLLLQPKPQDAKAAGLDEFDFPTAEPGRSIPVLFGTKVITGPNVVWYGDLNPEAIKGKRRYFFFGPRQTLGYRYHLGIHMVMCHGEVDYLRAIEVEGKWLWRGWSRGGVIEVNKPEFFGGKDQGGGIEGTVDILMGGPTQLQNDYLEGQVGPDTPGFRGVFSAVLNQVYLGNSPYIVPWNFRIQRAFKKSDGSDQWYRQTAGIGQLDVSDTAIYFAIDVSGSMYWENDIDVEREALSDLLDLIKDNYPSGNLDIRMVGWDHEVKSFIEKRNIQPDEFDELQDWVANDMNGGGGTDFTVGIVDAVAFFEGELDGGLFGNVTSPGSEERRRVLIFTTDGDPNDPATSAAAAAILESIENLEVYTFNISSGLVQYIEPLDNTDSDWSQEVFHAEFLSDDTKLDVGFFGNDSDPGPRANFRSPSFTDGEVAESIVTTPYAIGAFYIVWVLFRTDNIDGDPVIKARQFAINSSETFVFASSEDFFISEDSATQASGFPLVEPATPFVLDPVLLFTWTDENDDIRWRRFTSDNTSTDSVSGVLANLTGTGSYSRGVGLDDLGFLVVWQANPSGIYGNRILGRRFNSSGTAVTGELDFTADVSGSDHDKPGVCRRTDGSVVLAWLTDGDTLEQRILDTDAAFALLSEDTVAAGVLAGRHFSIASLTGGSHVIAYTRLDDDLDTHVYFQRYGSDGNKAGAATRVSSFTNIELEPSVSGLVGGPRGGGFVVVWQVQNQDGDGWGIYTRQFSSVGSPGGAPFNATTLTEFDQRYPSVSTSVNGKYVINWQDTNARPTPVLTHGDTDLMTQTIARAFLTHYDMNPAQIIRECLLDRVWGMGYNESDIDDDSFTRAADQLFEEEFGLSLLWDEEQEIEQFITVILSHIDGMLFVSRETGRFTLKLIRPDYDINDIFVASEDDVIDWSDVKRRQPAESVNSITVKYHEKLAGDDHSVQVHNPAAVMQLGSMISASREYRGITRRSLAIRVATRDLKSLSAGMINGTLVGKRSLSRLQPGEPFRLVSERQGFTGEVMRVLEIRLNDGRENQVRIKFVQDVFGLPDEVLVDDGPSEWQPSTEILVTAPRLVEEMPYYDMLVELGEVEIVSFLSLTPTAGFLLAAGVNPGSGAVNALVRIDEGDGYEDAGTLSYCPGGYLLAELKPLADYTSITVTDGVNLSQVTVGTMVAIGDEIARVSSIAGSPTFVIERGCEDTVPRRTAAGSSVLFFGLDYLPDFETRDDGAQTEVRMQTIVPSVGILPLASAFPDLLTFSHRAIRPYPVGRLKVEGSYRPATISGTADLTWKKRDRLIQGATIVPFDTNTDYGPESGTTYNLDVYGIDATGLVSAVFYSTTGLTGASYSFDTGAHAPPFDAVAILLRLTTVRDGYLSWQPAEAYCPLSTLSITGTPVTTGAVGISYVFIPVTTGGVPAYTFTISSGTLPTGLGVNVLTGVIGGIPTVAGTYPGIVLTVTDQLGATDSLPSFTIVIEAGSLPDPFIVLNFVDGIYSIDGVVVPYTDLLDDVDPLLIETAQGLQAFDGDNHYPVGTTLFKDRLYAEVPLGFTVAVETDFDGNVTDPYAAIMAILADFDGLDWSFTSLFEISTGSFGYAVYYLGNGGGHRYESFLRSSTLNRAALTYDRPVGGEFWFEYAVQGTMQGRSYFSDAADPMFDTVDDTAYMTGSIHTLHIGSNPPDYFNYSNVFIRSIIFYPVLTPNQQVYVAALNMTWDTTQPYHLPWTTTGIAYEVHQAWTDSFAPFVMDYGSLIWAFGGLPPVTFSVTTGSLPPGTSVDSHLGKISGTPTTLGDYSFTVTAADSSTNTDDYPMNVKVLEHYMDLRKYRRFGTSSLPFAGFVTNSTGFTPGPTLIGNRSVLTMIRVVSNPLLYDAQLQVDFGSEVSMTDVLTQDSLVGWRGPLFSTFSSADRIHAFFSPESTGTVEDRVIFRYQKVSGLVSYNEHYDLFHVWSPDPMRVVGVQIYNAYQGQVVAMPPVIAAPIPADGFVVVYLAGADYTGTDFYKEDFRGDFSGTSSIFLRATGDSAGDGDAVVTGSSLSSTNMYGAALALQPEDRPYLYWSSPAPPSSAFSYNVDMRRYVPAAGDRLIAFVTHRSTLTQVPQDWVLIDICTSTKTGITQYLSAYERRARTVEPAWETWKQTTTSLMTVQVVVARSSLGYLSMVDSATAAHNAFTTSANVFDLAPITATADEQMAVAGVASINSEDTVGGGNYMTALAGVWSTSSHYMLDQTTENTWNFSWSTRLSTGWRPLQNGASFSGSFQNASISTTTENGAAAVTALLDQAPLALSSDVDLYVPKGVAYGGFTVTGIQGTAPYTYSVASGSLPTGLSLNTGTGAVTGTATTLGVYQFTLRVTDNASLTADMARTLVVVDGPLAASLTHTTTTTSINPTFTGVSLGAAHANRHILVTLTCSDPTLVDTTIPNITSIGGVTAVELLKQSHGQLGDNAIIDSRPNSFIAIAHVPTGLTGDVVVSGSKTRWSLAVYRLVNLRNASLADGDALTALSIGANSTNTVTVTAEVGDFVVGAGVAQSASAWTLTTTLTSDYGVSAGTTHYGRHFSGIATSAGAVTATKPGSFTSPGLVLVVLRGNSPGSGVGEASGTSFVSGISTSLTADSSVITADEGDVTV